MSSLFAEIVGPQDAIKLSHGTMASKVSPSPLD